LVGDGPLCHDDLRGRARSRSAEITPRPHGSLASVARFVPLDAAARAIYSSHIL
jgi:hypothetical protein